MTAWKKSNEDQKEVLLINHTKIINGLGYLVHHEIICFGLSTQLLQQLINDTAVIIKEEGKLHSNKEYDNVFENSRVFFYK